MDLNLKSMYFHPRKELELIALMASESFVEEDAASCVNLTVAQRHRRIWARLILEFDFVKLQLHLPHLIISQTSPLLAFPFMKPA